MNRLEIRDYLLTVRLGCSPEERAIPQEVKISVEFLFQQSPRACETDQLEDTICYAQVCKALSKVLLERAYQTIERMAGVVMQEMKIFLPSSTNIKVKIHKVSPPIDGLIGGAIFESATD